MIHNQLVIIDDALDTFPDQDYFIYHRTDKNVRKRFAPIIGEHKVDIINRMCNTAPTEKVWLNVPTNADIHGYRSDYAATLYKMYARPIDSIPYDKTNRDTGKKDQYTYHQKSRKPRKYNKKVDPIIRIHSSARRGA